MCKSSFKVKKIPRSVLRAVALSGVSGTSASSGNLLGMLILRPHLTPAEPETLGLCFTRPSGGFWYTLKCENHLNRFLTLLEFETPSSKASVRDDGQLLLVSVFLDLIWIPSFAGTIS